MVFVGEGARCAGLVVMSDPLRAGARAAVEALRAAGLSVRLVTGDHADTARGLARSVGIDEVTADALPVEKFALVQKLKGEGRARLGALSARYDAWPGTVRDGRRRSRFGSSSPWMFRRP